MVNGERVEKVRVVGFETFAGETVPHAVMIEGERYLHADVVRGHINAVIDAIDSAPDNDKAAAALAGVGALNLSVAPARVR